MNTCKRPLRVFIPRASRFALSPEHYKFQYTLLLKQRLPVTTKVTYCNILKKWGETLDYVSCFSLHFFRALAASCVLYNRTEHSQGFSICQLKNCATIPKIKLKYCFCCHLSPSNISMQNSVKIKSVV